jgi:hypothetical protein
VLYKVHERSLGLSEGRVSRCIYEAVQNNRICRKGKGSKHGLYELCNEKDTTKYIKYYAGLSYILGGWG